MTNKHDFKKYWSDQETEHRRTRLNELGANENKTDDEQREHDVLAEMVAEDEDDAQKAERE